MPSEKLVEKPILKHVETKKPSKVEKAELPDQHFEKPSSSVEKIVKPAQPLEKVGEGSIVASSQAQDEAQRRSQVIDAILSEGLDGVFLDLSPEKQKEFKIKGEKTVKEINSLLSKTKIKVNKIIILIKSWLKVIPGVNKFFLEQESKIKADKIIDIKNKF